jgi:hypothetical protein
VSTSKIRISFLACLLNKTREVPGVSSTERHISKKKGFSGDYSFLYKWALIAFYRANNVGIFSKLRFALPVSHKKVWVTISAFDLLRAPMGLVPVER